MPVWNAFSEGDINTLERVQRLATKVAHTLKRFKYEKRCEMLKITSLKERRTRGDLIQKFKIENNLDEIEWPFNPNCGQPRGGHRWYFFREIVKNCDQIAVIYC